MRPEEIQNRIINGRCEEVLKDLDDDSIDFILTSPPYADKRDYAIENTSSSPAEYLDWFKPMAKEIHRVLKNNGSFVLNISD